MPSWTGRPRFLLAGFAGHVAAVASLVAGTGGGLSAQASARGEELTISLVTMGPGQEVWERFGHNAIWVHDTVRHQDLQYNYGLFSFKQENFILRFVQGRMLYSMGGFDAGASMADYVAHNRSIWVQELDLTPGQRADLRDFLEWNAREENRHYRYDYYRDNCSTRVRDAIDRVIGGRIRAATAGVAAPGRATFRFHTARLTSSQPVVYTGLMLGLGEPVDRPISKYEEMFLPLAFREHVREVHVPGADGRLRPLVKSERIVFQSTQAAPPSTPPSWFSAYLAIGAAVGALLFGLGRRATRNRPARITLAVLGGLWGVVSGLSGTVLASLWALTDHTASYANENLFQLNPLALLLAVLVPLAALGAARWRRRAATAAALLVTIGVAGIAFKLVPGTRQVNGFIIALVLPIHLGLWLGLRARMDGPAPAR